MENINLGYSELSDRVYMGKSKNLGNGMSEFTGEKKDITNEFLGVCEQYFEVGTSRVVKKGDEESLYIHIENTREGKEKLIKHLTD